MIFDSTQKAAIERATTTRFSICTGSAGTGKTSIIKEITRQLEAKGEKVNLCAFAGKAAARIREACEHPASTIHRMLGYDGRAYNNPSLEDCTVIADECSMVDSLLVAEIVKRKPRRFCMVGDQAQLAPVGRGQPFHDILSLRPELVSNLTTCYRATEAVFQAANAIRNGERPPLHAESPGEKWTMMNTGNAKHTQAQILKWVEAGQFDFEQDIILCARNGESDDEPCTVRGLNKAIVDLISPREEKRKFEVGDRIINTKNITELDFFNGSSGSIHSIDQDGGIWIKSDIPVIDWSKSKDAINPVYTDYVLFSKEHKKHLQLAYALTVHKAQGSSYRNVLFVSLQRDSFCLLDRSLIYTAVTRTRSACCVVGELSSFYAGLNKQNHKRTVLQLLSEMD